MRPGLRRENLLLHCVRWIGKGNVERVGAESEPACNDAAQTEGHWQTVAQFALANASLGQK